MKDKQAGDGVPMIGDNISEPDPLPVEGDGGCGVDLLWIPLGAGAHVVRISGKLFEAVSALIRRRPPCDRMFSHLIRKPRRSREATDGPQGEIEIASTPDVSSIFRPLFAHPLPALD